MNKSDLIDTVAEATGQPRAQVNKAVDALLNQLTDALKKGESVTLPGFGTFLVKERAGRTGRNPRTGEAIEISAARVPGFKPGKALRDAVN